MVWFYITENKGPVHFRSVEILKILFQCFILKINHVRVSLQIKSQGKRIFIRWYLDIQRGGNYYTIRKHPIFGIYSKVYTERNIQEKCFIWGTLYIIIILYGHYKIVDFLTIIQLIFFWFVSKLTFVIYLVPYDESRLHLQQLNMTHHLLIL